MTSTNNTSNNGTNNNGTNNNGTNNNGTDYTGTINTTSILTASAARGFTLYAEFMACADTLSADQARVEDRWDVWAATHPSLVPLVHRVHGCVFNALLVAGAAK
jgi:hypothetical protein